MESVWLTHEPKAVEREASIIIRQCLKAAVGCHSKGFIHRDLRPENFTLNGKDLTIKLINLGRVFRVVRASRQLGKLVLRHTWRPR